MLLLKKNWLAIAAFVFCAQVFLACSDSDSSSAVEEYIATHKASLDSKAKPDSTTKDSTQATQKNTTEPGNTTEPDSVVEDSTKGFKGFDEQNTLHTTIMNDSSGLLIYSDLYLDYPADSFLTKFDYGDIVTVAIDGYDTLEMPVVETNGNDVPIAWFALVARDGSDNLIMTIHNGLLAEILGLTGVNPINVTVSMKEKGGFRLGLDIRFIQYMDYYTENYPNLSIQEFANFREVRTTGMGKNKLFRSSSPVDPCLGRNFKADSLAEEAGVATFINLADSENSAKSFKNFDSSYYASQNAIFLALPVEFFSKPFRDGLAKGFRYMIEHEGPYLVHCTYGMDRTGFTIAILEALMGATTEEIQADYAKTFSNYYYVVDGKQITLDEQQVGFFKTVVIRNLKAVYHAQGIEITDTANADWASATEKYFEILGMTPEEISALKEKLK